MGTGREHHMEGMYYVLHEVERRGGILVCVVMMPCGAVCGGPEFLRDGLVHFVFVACHGAVKCVLPEAERLRGSAHFFLSKLL